MLEAITRILDSLTPVFVAATTVYGSVLVAKINKVHKDTQATNDKVTKVQQDIVTNHESKNLGDAIDRLTTKVSVISDNQDELIATIKGMQAREAALETRMSAVEIRRPHPASQPHTRPIPIKFMRRKK